MNEAENLLLTVLQDDKKLTKNKPTKKPKKNDSVDTVKWREVDKSLQIDKNGESYAAFDLSGLLFFNYYIGYLSILTHFVVHAFLLGYWCSYSKIIIGYSFQVFLLHAYSWAIPDRRF